MLLSVFTRHTPQCPFKANRHYRRCNCPKWIGGQINRDFFRQSARTRQWAEAEAYRLELEQALEQGQPPFDAPDAQPSPTPAPEPPPALPPAAASVHRNVLAPALATSSAFHGLSGEVLPPLGGEDPEAPPARAKKPRTTIADAVDAHIADARSRELASSTIDKLETLFRKQFLHWTKIHGYTYLDQLDLDAMLNFRNTWADGKLAKQKKQSRVIGFFWACVRRGYLREHPCLGFGKIKVVQVPTDYFPRDEFERILDAIPRYGDPRGGFIPVEDTRARLRALTLLMRWSGLRIRDAVTLERHRLHGDSLLLYQAKTGTPVYVPLPPFVLDALKNIPPGPKPNPRYFFWSGNGQPKSAVADWQRSYRRLFELASITRAGGDKKRCHPHMFRDTFAVEMLLAGVPIDQVSLLLGHASVKITEKSYAPFVKARQIQLQESVRNAWEVGDSTPPPGPQPPVQQKPDNARSGWQVIRSPKLAKPAARKLLKG